MLQMNRPHDAVRYFSEAAQHIQSHCHNNNFISRASGCAVEIFSNYGFALRKLEKFEKSIECYEIALSLEPKDADIHTNKGYVHHLMRR